MLRKPYRVVNAALVLYLWSTTPIEGERRSTTDDVHLIASTLGGQTVFHVGELIRLQLSYSLAPDTPIKYVISNASYDRSGRLGIEDFQVEPAAGWDDPLRSYFASFSGFIGGGLSSSDTLTTKPAVLTRDLNEWVRFNSPGHYRVRVESTRVQPTDYQFGSTPMKVLSNPIELTIIPATPEWQKSTLDRAIEVLDKPAPARRNAGFMPVSDERDTAAATLRYVGTPDAAVEMGNRINDEHYGYVFMLGLASTPAREAALAKLQELLHDPTFPVTGTLLHVLSLVALPSEMTENRPEQEERLEQRFREELLEALGSKQGRARAVSAYTIVNEWGVRSLEMPVDQKRELTKDLVSGFDSLAIQDQQALLQYRWGLLDHSTMATLLPGIVEGLPKSQKLRGTPPYDSNELSGLALTRLWSLDPDAARPLIIREIMKPQPRFGAEVLGILPDRDLPEVEQVLVDHLTAGAGSEPQIASLLSRYATPAVEPAVTSYLQPAVGKLACAIQAPLLAYLLRVDSDAAMPFLQRAMTARGPGFSACNRSLLVDIANSHDDAVLQEVAITSLADEDPQVAAGAARYLGERGDAAAEAPLWTRLQAWSSKWKGRERELRYVPGENMAGVWDAGLGTSLISALATGQAWLTDEASLERLAALSVTPDQRQQLEQLRRSWQEQPRQIQFIPFQQGQFNIAQYHATSVESAIAKLKQFPKGSRFIWTGDLTQEGERQSFDEIRKALSAYGIVIDPSPVEGSKQ